MRLTEVNETCVDPKMTTLIPSGEVRIVAVGGIVSATSILFN